MRSGSLASEKTSAEGAAATVIQEDRSKTNKASVAPSALIHVCDLIPASRPGLCTVGPSGLSQDSGLPTNMSYAPANRLTIRRWMCKSRLRFPAQYPVILSPALKSCAWECIFLAVSFHLGGGFGAGPINSVNLKGVLWVTRPGAAVNG